MAQTDQILSVEKRLGQQIYGLSELIECLTLRLLELEERLQNWENIQSSQDQQPEGLTKELLLESESKVKRLQRLLEMSTDLLPPSHSVEDSKVQQDLELGTRIEDFEKEDLLDENNVEDQISVETEYIDDPQMPLLSA